MSKKRQKKTTLKSAILLLLLMAVLLITSSYAWFTANQTVQVSTLTVNVQAANGLQISVDGQSWKAILSNEDLTTEVNTLYASNTNQIPTELAPVSTTGVVTNGKMEMYYGEVDTNDDGDYILISTKQTDTKGATGYYIAFDIFLKVNAVTPIYLTTASGVRSSVVTTTTDQGLKNAARIAFVNEGNVADGTLLSDIQALSLTSGTAKIWEPNYEMHTASAKGNAVSYYGKAEGDFTETGSGTGLFTATQLPYYGVKAEFTADDDILVRQATTPGSNFALVSPSYSTKTDFTDYQAFDTLQAGITKYRIYMWVEGQDVDCENGASGTYIDFDLQFSTKSSPTT
ncbi:MAG: hypothetical protein ACI4VQ_00485 [Clostridia bacterium]